MEIYKMMTDFKIVSNAINFQKTSFLLNRNCEKFKLVNKNTSKDLL